MDLKEQLNGIQHIGIPTNDIEATIDFYKALGFEIAFRTVNEEADEEVAFLAIIIISHQKRKVSARPVQIFHQN